jgi:hypothetical protein
MSALPLRRVCPENVQSPCLRLRRSDTPDAVYVAVPSCFGDAHRVRSGSCIPAI